ncbi:MAG: hypothetical protein OEV59_04770 [Deltaproteobacteria bacterium]|nr:hypothetical protein [Deltaproteobacteria bacterium]
MSGIRYRIVSKYIGTVFLVMAAVFAVTAACAVVYGEKGALYFFLPASIASAAIGVFLIKRVPEKDVADAEAAAVAALSFLTASIIGAVPFVFLTGSPLIDAWFEAMSGVTTTGFSLLTVDTAPRSVVFYRALLQWIGGLGFIIITAAVFLVSGRPAVTLLKDAIEEKVFARITKNIRTVALTYFVFTLAGIILLLIFGIKVFDAVSLAMAGISTGGFAPVSDISVLYSPWQVFFPLIVIMFLGSTNFMAYYKELKEQKTLKDALRAVATNPQFLTLTFTMTIAGIVFAVIYDGPHEAVEGIFLAVSAHSTTGFTLSPVTAFPEPVLMLAIVLMFVGGSVGSTAGGIKISRAIDVFKGLKRFALSTIYPREMVSAGDEGKKDGLSAAIYVITLYTCAVIVSAVIFVMSGYGPLLSVFEVVSAASTVGLSGGIVSPELASPLKLILIFLMWGGRLEFIALMIWGAAIIARR